MSSVSTEIVAMQKKRPKTDSQTEQQIIARLQAGDAHKLISEECEVCLQTIGRIKKRFLQSSMHIFLGFKCIFQINHLKTF